MSRVVNQFTPQVLLQDIEALPDGKRYLVGFSGGADSTALLLALHQLAAQIATPLAAVHFNHGLQDSADDWEQHCRQFCQQRNIPLQVTKLTLQSKAQTSFETAARRARYQCIAKMMAAGDIYLTAHQAEDQAETMFINLMRGSGSEGLAGIPRLRKYSQGWLARPLLNVSRAALETYLIDEQVSWVSDMSNLDQSMDRSFLRNHIFPLLDQRWPGLVQRLNQSAEHMREQGSVLRELLSHHHAFVSADGITLCCKALNSASPLIQAEMIRHWARENGATPPPRERLREFLMQLQDIRADSQAELRWGQWLIKHHAALLWMHELPQASPCPNLSWDGSARLPLGTAHGFLLLDGSTDIPLPHAQVSHRSALPADLDQPKSIRRKIKEIMRISGIPVWLRDTVPVLFLDGKLSAVGDWWLAPEFRQQLQTANLVYRWQPEHVLLKKIQSVGHNCAVDPGFTLV